MSDSPDFKALDRARELSVEIGDRLYNLHCDNSPVELEEVLWKGAEEEHEAYLSQHLREKREAREEEG